VVKLKHLSFWGGGKWGRELGKEKKKKSRLHEKILNLLLKTLSFYYKTFVYRENT